MGERKSVDIKQKQSKQNELYIVTEKRDPIVEDFLPEFHFKYNVENDEEAENIVNSMTTFIRANDSLVLGEYNSKNLDAVKEGFARGVAICQLFLRSLYVEEDGVRGWPIQKE